MLKSFRGIVPEVHETAFVEESAQVIGDVKIGAHSSVWFNAVIRADVNSIRIGERTNIQDGCLLHVTLDRHDLVIGDDVTIGHGAIIHGCHIGSNCLIGMGSIILDGAKIGENCIVASGAVVAEGSVIPPNTLVMGVPAKPKRAVTEKDLERVRAGCQRYILNKEIYKREVQEVLRGR
jgi:carbonic anhydrase/acetyltransferase-like protein (isoleucine patch superfamily)